MVLVIGDVHGHLDLLRGLLDKSGVSPGPGVCLTGDMVDRGPDSRGVVSFVRSTGISTVLGNHEKMMLDTLLPVLGGMPAPMDHRRHWFMNGGKATLLSYGFTAEDGDDYLNAKKALPAELVSDLEWMADLPYYKEYPDEVDHNGAHLVVSHSNCLVYWDSKDHPLAKESILWDRAHAFDITQGTFHLFNIFGHTPQSDVFRWGNIACVDTGAFHTGVLSGMTFPEKTVHHS